jgi:hypothetical protein
MQIFVYSNSAIHAPTMVPEKKDELEEAME